MHHIFLFAIMTMGSVYDFTIHFCTSCITTETWYVVFFLDKAPKFHTSSRSKMSTHHKSKLNIIWSANPWLFCQGHLWSCNYTASLASTFKDDLQYRVHLATLIILMLMGSTVARLFQGPGWTAKNTKELEIDVEPLHAITHRSVLSMWKLIVSRMKMGTRCEGCHVACCIRMQSA